MIDVIHYLFIFSIQKFDFLRQFQLFTCMLFQQVFLILRTYLSHCFVQFVGKIGINVKTYTLMAYDYSLNIS